MSLTSALLKHFSLNLFYTCIWIFCEMIVMTALITIIYSLN